MESVSPSPPGPIGTSPRRTEDRPLLTGAGRFLDDLKPDGLVHLTLRGPDGTVRAALLAAQTSSLALSTPAQASGATLTALEDGSGALTLKGEGGRIRYRVP